MSSESRDSVDSGIAISDDEEINDEIKLKTKYKAVELIQSTFRGYSIRKKRLPNVLYKIKNILESKNYELSQISDDGRINSCIDENLIIQILLKEIPNRIKKVNKECGMIYLYMIISMVGCL